MKTNGFALTFTLLFLLLLTLFGFSVLLLAANYFGSTQNLFEKENARLACDQAIRTMVDRHNMEPGDPRFFHDSRIWQGRTMTPMTWNGHEITAELDKTWNPAASNLLQAAARKGRFAASRAVELRQRRLEDFALYTDAAAALGNAALFDGPVFARGGLSLETPGVRFRSIVQGQLQPASYASLMKPVLQELDYPQLQALLDPLFLQQQALSHGLQIRGHNAAFWSGSRYLLNLDLLQMERLPRNRWRIAYSGTLLGTVEQPVLWFDEDLAVTQSAAVPAFYIAKPSAPVYLASAGDVRILSSLHQTEDAAYRHPVAVAAEDAIYIDAAAPRSLCLEALLLAFGSDDVDGGASGLIVQDSGQPTSEADLQWIRSEITTSAFLLEDTHREAALLALAAGERLIWLRGGLVLSAPWHVSEPDVHLHFQGSGDSYPLLPSLPFVYIVEGSELWL